MLDWSVVVDKPHGSLRLLGSQKAVWMVKGEPQWVYVKYYSPAKWDGERWATLPITYDIVSRCGGAAQLAGVDALGLLACWLGL
jgi:hypothetical protein